MTQSRYDAIVIGAGVNGLVTAHYLARAGRRVLVVEREPNANAALDVGWVPPQVVHELDLERHGLRFTHPDPWIAAPLEGGGRLELWRDLGRSVDAIRLVSPADAAKWPDFCARMRRLATVLERLYVAPPPDIESRDPRELTRIAGLGLYVRRLGKQTVIDLARVLPMSIAELLDDWFESDALKGVLGAVGVWHLKQGPRSGGTAFNFLHHHVGSPIGVFRPPVSNIASVLLGLPGIEILRGQEAFAIHAPHGQLTGVALGPSGDTIEAPLVVSGADPRDTFEHLKPNLDPEFVRAIDNIKCRGVVAKGTLVWQGPTSFTSLCIAPSLEYLERAYDAAKYGRDSERPYVELRAEDGHIEVHVQYVPFRNRDSNAEHHHALRAAVVGALAPHVPEIKAAESRLVLKSPDQLQLTEGHLYHGELTLDQILFMRPVPGWSRYRTPLDGLYLCGAGTHPGGGIAGAAGRNGARVILKETKRS
ncbi:MAG TPA: NAD(P)/FAD-dependent oxidoreductase [Gemmatimonadales bacterium]|nr:NAD(P)/FAD-dependent oxidoreductase [Gemmatimonadales bacterium]